MTEHICPACGSEDVQVLTKNRLIKESFGIQSEIAFVENICNTCGTVGDFQDLNEKIEIEAIAKLKSDVAVWILDSFQEQKLNLSSIERALELPQRTLAKWKNRSTNPSATGVSLLKFIKLFPWLLEVGDQKFDPIAADRIMIKNASDRFFNKVTTSQDLNIETGVQISGNNLRVYVDLFMNAKSDSHLSTLAQSDTFNVASSEIFTIA